MAGEPSPGRGGRTNASVAPAGACTYTRLSVPTAHAVGYRLYAPTGAIQTESVFRNGALQNGETEDMSIRPGVARLFYHALAESRL